MQQGLSASQEDYLEAISHIVDQKQAARTKDIADRLSVASSSVTRALHSLAEVGLINYTPYDFVTLTDEGRVAAHRIIRKHETLKDFFVKVLLVDEEEADRAACKMEHAIPQTILERFVRFIEYSETRSADWLKDFPGVCDATSEQAELKRDEDVDSDN